MKKHHLFSISIALTVATSTCYAEANDNGLVFTCKTSRERIVTVQQDRKGVIYRFGPKYKPEIEISVPTRDFIWTESWGTGDGGNGKVFCFENGDTTYEVSYLEYNYAPFSIDGGISVTRDDKEVVYIPCVKNTAHLNLSNLKAKRSELDGVKFCSPIR